MTKEAIFERISFIIKEQMNKPDMKITQTTSLHDDLGVDSITLMEFIINLEDEFHLEIPDLRKLPGHMLCLISEFSVREGLLSGILHIARG